MHFTNASAALNFCFSFWKILNFRPNEGFQQGMLLLTETISWPVDCQKKKFSRKCQGNQLLFVKGLT